MDLFKECPVPIWQDPKEFDKLLGIVDNIEPFTIMEIGSLNGGTLWTWLNRIYCKRLISVDLMVSKNDFRYIDQYQGHAGLWHDWAWKQGTLFRLYEQKSQYPFVIEGVKKNLYDQSTHIDFLFIDGGHSYEEVKADYENYSPLVRDGGIIAFHDINEAECPDVVKFWEELKPKVNCHEIKYLNNKWGIGVIYVGYDFNRYSALSQRKL